MSSRGIVAITGLWLLIAVGGLALLWRYETSPGELRQSPAVWPQESSVRHYGRPTLVHFVHPQCPCTRASLAELEKIAARCEGQVDINVLFVMPPDSNKDWEQSDLIHVAKHIPGATVEMDIGGVEAEKFGARTSGLCLLYDSSKHLTFHGGITSSRGHEGDNGGATAIRNAVLLGSQPQCSTPVFGCALFDAKSAVAHD